MNKIISTLVFLAPFMFYGQIQYKPILVKEKEVSEIVIDSFIQLDKNYDRDFMNGIKYGINMPTYTPPMYYPIEPTYMPIHYSPMPIYTPKEECICTCKEHQTVYLNE